MMRANITEFRSFQFSLQIYSKDSMCEIIKHINDLFNKMSNNPSHQKKSAVDPGGGPAAGPRPPPGPAQSRVTTVAGPGEPSSSRRGRPPVGGRWGRRCLGRAAFSEACFNRDRGPARVFTDLPGSESGQIYARA